MIPAWDRELRALHEEAAYMAAVASVPALAPWGDPARTEPINRVEAMGHLRNVLRRLVVDGQPVALGVHAVGDALCHTNPGLGWGMTLAVAHAFALADVLREAPGDPYAQALALDARLWGKRRHATATRSRSTGRARGAGGAR
jgi:flavin-dependent dehydrogenase